MQTHFGQLITQETSKDHFLDLIQSHELELIYSWGLESDQNLIPLKVYIV